MMILTADTLIAVWNPLKRMSQNIYYNSFNFNTKVKMFYVNENSKEAMTHYLPSNYHYKRIIHSVTATMLGLY